MNNFIKNYKARGYVQHIKRGQKFFWAGIPIMIAIAIYSNGSPLSEVFMAAGGFWAFMAGVIHFFDSKTRIQKLREKLKNDNKLS